MIAPQRTQILDLSSFSIALLLHGLIVLGLIAAPRPPGAGLRETAAISLNLSETRIVDAAEQNTDQAADAADAEVSETEGAREDSAPSPLRRKQQKDEQKPDVKPAGSKPVAAPQARKFRQKSASQPSKASRKGGAQSRAKSGKKASSGAVSASRGAMNSYAGRVRARIASRKPRGMRARGTAHVSFGISHSGGLRYVRLLRSSGNKSLDSAAISAIRRSSPFPRPPAGMSLRQLSFNIPLYFK